MLSNRVSLLVALGTDNFGSGLFLPVVLLYVTRVVGLPLAAAGTVVSLGTVAGLAVPPAAGRLVDRTGPRLIVICAQLLQAAGAVTYLTARGIAAVAAAAVLLAAGQQLFYSSLLSLISDVAGDGPKDRPFAVAAMVRSASFGLGGLTAGTLLGLAGPASYRVAVAIDAGSFAMCALLLALLVRTPRARDQPAAPPRGDTRGLLSDWPFLALIASTGLIALAADFFLSGSSVYILADLHARPWLPGAVLALLTGLSSAGATLAVRATRRLARTTTMSLGAALYVAWCAASLAALIVAPRWRPLELLGATLVLAAAGSLFYSRTSALAEAAAPRAVRARYLAAYQYAFTIPAVIAPAVVALYAVAVWLPWLLVGTCSGVAILALRWLAGRLPVEAVRPAPVTPRTPRTSRASRASRASHSLHAPLAPRAPVPSVARPEAPAPVS
jgi:MFS family permease